MKKNVHLLVENPSLKKNHEVLRILDRFVFLSMKVFTVVFPKLTGLLKLYTETQNSPHSEINSL